MSREIRDIVRMIKDLDPKSQHRTDMSAAFLEKMYSIGLIPIYLKLSKFVVVSLFQTKW